jgi:hypothetical protein
LVIHGSSIWKDQKPKCIAKRLILFHNANGCLLRRLNVIKLTQFQIKVNEVLFSFYSFF